MHIVNISQFEDGIVLHFETEGRRINAYTLASTLVALADAAKAANYSVNQGHEVEIVVEALGPGSFRARIKAVYTKANNLFSNQLLQGIVIGVISSYIYERTLSVDDSVKVKVNTDEVIVERGEDRIIVPRNIYDATRDVEKNPQFTRAIARTMEAVSNDEYVSALGFVTDMNSPQPDILIPRSIMQQLSTAPGEDPSTRIIEERCSLQIVKAILEKSHRKWEFVWRGVKISAPIIDEKFYADFSKHIITIAPGDELQVRLAIKQTRNPKNGIYTNIAYEVIEVLRHVPGIRQTPFNYGP
ncbi:MAG: hypothetical protein IT443_08785 [Phycisphaeraceae bacterium]|nr:hypothetical protein [Phycisphaeraceae bacterium]